MRGADDWCVLLPWFNNLLWVDQAGGGASQTGGGNDDPSARDGRTDEKAEGREL